MTQKQILSIMQKLKEENKIKISDNVLNGYISGRTRDKFDPKFMMAQCFFNEQVLLKCFNIGSFKQGIPKTFTLTKSYQNLYSSDFESIFKDLKIESQKFEKRLKEKDKEVAFFRKFEVSFDVSRKVYVPHFHYLVLSELETEEIEGLSPICVYSKELSVVKSKKNQKTSIERVASYLSKQFVTIVKDFKKSTWSSFMLDKDNFKQIKDFIGSSYDVLKNTVIYKYYGKYKEVYQKHLAREKQARKDYCERVLSESKGDEEYFKILNLKNAREKRQERKQEKEVNKAIETKRKKRVKEYKAIAKAMEMNLNLKEPKIDRNKLLDMAYILVSNLYGIDRETEVFNTLFGEKEKEGGSEMARTRRDTSEDFANQLKLFKSRDEIEKEERIKERKQWLDSMTDFFTPDTDEVRQEISARKERVKLLRELAVILFQFEYRIISETKIKVIGLNIFNWLSITRLTSKKRLYGFNFALELIMKLRLTLSSSEFRVQEKKYKRGKREKVKKVIRPPPFE